MCLKGRSPVPFLGWLCVPAVACGVRDGAEAILLSSSAPSPPFLLLIPTYSLGYLLPMLSYSFLSLMSAMHPSLGRAFRSDSWELGTHVLGDLLEFVALQNSALVTLLVYFIPVVWTFAAFSQVL